MKEYAGAHAWTLARLVKFVCNHPGLTTPGVANAIRTAKRSEDPPALSSIQWKLNYLELAGYVEHIDGHWYPSNSTIAQGRDS